MVRPRSILFLHIPKTAGTSVKHYLFHHFPADACLMDPTESAAGRLADPGDYALTAGHLDHDYVQRYRQRPFVLTCLRQPVQRSLSAYYYQREPRLALEIRSLVPQMGAFAEQILADLRRLNDYALLAEFLRHEPELARKHLGNIQTRYLAGAAAADAYANHPERLVETAIDHLRACEGILLTECLPETLAVVAPNLGLGALPKVPHDNTTGERRPAVEHDAGVLASLVELTELDAELYRVGADLVETRSQTPPTAAAAFDLLPQGLPLAADFTFDQPIYGGGWHIRERSERGWFCWTDREARLRLALTTTGEHLLECTVEHASCLEAWQSLEISVNGSRLESVAQPPSPPATLTARVPARILDALPGRVCIALRVQRVIRPSDHNPSSPDTRRLGVALSRVRLRPLGPP